MKQPIKIRIQLSLSQEQLAGWLGIPRSTLNLCELGLRKLPSRALLKIAELEQLYKDSLNKVRTIPQKNSSSYTALAYVSRLKEKLQQRINNCYVRLTSLQQRLRKMEKDYYAICASFNIYTELLSSLTDEPKNKGSRLWLQIQLDELELQLQGCGVEDQFLLEHKIDLLQSETLKNEMALKHLISE